MITKRFAYGGRLTSRAKSFFRTLAELLRCRTKSSLPRDDADWNAFWLRRKREKFHSIAEGIVEGVRSDGYSCTRVHRREKPGPTIMLLNEARFILHTREDSINVYPVLRIFLVQ